MKQHLLYNKIKLCSFGQWCLSNGQLSRACDIMNILGYWGDDYAENTFCRIADRIPTEYLVLEHISTF